MKKIDRRNFLLKARDLSFQIPVLLSAVSLSSCFKPLQGDVPGPISSKTVVPDAAIVDGYLDKQSYFPGEECTLFISSDKTYLGQDIATYDAAGKLVYKIPFTSIRTQAMQTDVPYENGFGYQPSITFTIPKLKSNVYLIANKIPLVIKSSNANIDFTVVYPTNTENAYCNSGGKSLYVNPNPSTTIVSYLRPIPFSYYAGGFFRWILAHQNYSYNVISDTDLEDASNIKGKLLVIPGHNEYWTRNARLNFDGHVNSGKPALILSGNTMYWQVRYANSGSNDLSGGINQLICYKSAKTDPDTDPLLKTCLWIDPSLKYPQLASIGVNSQNGGFGDRGTESWKGFKITNPNSPLFSGTGLKTGDILPCSTHEYDGTPKKGVDQNGFPIIDDSLFYKSILLGFDKARDYTDVNKYNFATAVVTQHSASSGVVVNFPSTDWCTIHNLREDGGADLQIHKITKNALDCLLNDVNLF